MSPALRRIIVFFAVLIPVLVIGFAFRHRLIDWVNTLGKNAEEPVLITQVLSTATPSSSAAPGATATPSPTPKAAATSVPTATPKPISGATSIAMAVPTNGTLPAAGPGEDIPLAAGGLTFVIGAVRMYFGRKIQK